MKIVTMCRGGNVRSVAAKMILQRYFGHEVIAIGADNTNESTKKFVFDWADEIIILSWKIYYQFPFCKSYDHKIMVMDVGNDVWGTPFSENLQLSILNKLKTDSWKELTNGKTISPEEVVKTIREYKEKIKDRNSLDSSL